MIKKEKSFISCLSLPVIGEPCILKVQYDGETKNIRTSKVEDYMFWKNGDIKITTRNTVYLHHDN